MPARYVRIRPSKVSQVPPVTDKQKRKPTRPVDYSCHRCKKKVDRDDLRRVTVGFETLDGKRIRSRITEWICVPCMEVDPVYLREKHIESPGFEDLRG